MTIDPEKWLAYADLVFKRDAVPTEAIFLHGWGDLMEETIDRAATLFHTYKAQHFFLNGESVYDTATPQWGFEFARNRLIERRVPEGAIRAVTPARNTKEEAEKCMELIAEEHITSLTVISVPQHILRAYLTDLEQMKRRHLTLRLYPETVQKIDWEAPLRIEGLLGQAPQETTRLGRLVNECARIASYRSRYESGDENFPIASIEDAVDYLRSIS